MNFVNSEKFIRFLRFFWCICICYSVCISSINAKWVDESVWSEKLGDELWDISRLVTKQAKIKSSYTNLTATVIDGKTLLNDIVQNIQNMLKKKTQAVKCIVDAAEELRRNSYFMSNFKLEYYNMKYSLADGSDYSPTVPWELDELTEYKNMSLEPDPNFYNIPVNTNYSAVHIPTNVYDRYEDLAETISWSENLDDVFLKNYRADPELGWQYFGSANGMMRQFPAMQWSPYEEDIDLYDCRTRPWFIEAVTCTKHVVILMDNSGSMTGMRNTIAKLVVNSLLTTFGNNDFISVLRFSWKAESVLPCYKDMLVQATPETLKNFQEAVSEVKPEGNASFPNAFTYSLKLLEKYRENRHCGNDGGCNQAIMLVTDGLPGNVTEVFEALNSDENGIPPVRVFTYLVGTEVKGVQELQLMACRNRGYYVHIHDLDEVHDQVLKYIPVVARPLVMQGEMHPVVWTHAFADVHDPKLTEWLWKIMSNEEQENRLLQHHSIKPEYFSKQREDSKYVQKITQTQGEPKDIKYQEYRLMTSVSVPAFDKKRSNETKSASLLGVAGTDVPLNQIHSLTYPYKSGSNGYIFIVTNNGYLIMHPDLRPVYDGILKINYNSIDLAEVEFLDYEDVYKGFSSEILEIRKNMVDQVESQYLNKMVKFHYDDINRVGVEKRDFYLRPLPGTPFSIALVVPSDFAAYQIPANAKAEHNDANLTQTTEVPDIYLKMKNSDERDPEWIIHPDWTYCKYHFPTFMKFDSKEDELLHFLKRIGEPRWEWKEQYTHKSGYEGECDQPELNDNDYYCDRDLMELLITDLKILENFRKPIHPKNSFETRLLDTYNPNLRFVATQTGLTKWQIIPKPKPGKNTTSDFVTAYPKTISEPWYKMAVMQHQEDEDSFVFSVPFQTTEDEEIYVIATHAIFHKKTQDGKKGSAAVLGYRFEHSSFYERFMEITSETDKFTLPCYSDARECYILDHNGYIIVSSKSPNETGQFFGKYEGSVMRYLVEKGVFQEKVVYDYQGLCIEEIAVSSKASIFLTPLIELQRLINYFFIDILWNAMQMLSCQFLNYEPVYSIKLDSREFKDYDSDESISGEEEDEEYEEDKEEFLNTTVRIERKTWPCDKNKTLYILQQDIFSEKHIYGIRHNSSRFRFVNRIPHTNLILVVINKLYSNYDDIKLTVEATELPPDECIGTNVLDLHRRKLSKCFTHHPEELEVEACGKGSTLKSYCFSILFLITLVKKLFFKLQ